MIVWSTVEAGCPICSQRMRLRLLGSGFVSGQDSDLLLRMSTRHIIQVEVHTCPRCRFSGYVDDFLQDIPEALGRRFLEEVAPRLLNETPGAAISPADQERIPLPDVQYFWAYRAAVLLGLPPWAQGERLLRAYWCLRLPPSVGLLLEVKEERKRFYLKGAIQKLRQSLPESGEPNLDYLIGELCRRNGNFRLAAKYFRRYMVKPAGARYLKQAAEKLLCAARERVSQEMSMEEVLYDRAPDGSRGGHDGP